MKIAMTNIGRWGDTDIFPKPIDNLVVSEASDEFEVLLRNRVKNVSDDLGTSPPTVIKSAVPVGYSGFRWGTQIDPLWNAYLLSSVIDIAEEIEKVRVSDDVVFSHRNDPKYDDGRLFRGDGYVNFVNESAQLAEKHSHVVITDIADFYGRIYHHRLENALLGVPRQSGSAKRIVKVLGAISGGRSYGLPVGGPAARILAEILLDKVDKSLLGSGVKFLRYADDYRIFAGSEDQAHAHLSTLSDLLSSNEGLTLQKAKTRILTSAEYIATVSLPSVQGARLSGAELKARQLLSFSLRFDPYSEDPAGDFERLAEAVDELDLVDLFSVELSKSRVDPQFTKKLLRALQFARPDVKSAVAESLCLNLALLAPVFPQVMGAIKGLWGDISEEARSSVVDSIVDLWQKDSYLLRPGVSRAYAVRLLAEHTDQIAETTLVAIFADRNTDASTRRDVILAMSRRASTWWLSARLQDFDLIASRPERRAFLAATAVMTEEAVFFKKRRRRSFDPLEIVTMEWAAKKRSSDQTWVPPV